MINTRTGTRTLKDGDLVRVDGSTGLVNVLQTASPDTASSNRLHPSS